MKKILIPTLLATTVAPTISMVSCTTGTINVNVDKLYTYEWPGHNIDVAYSDPFNIKKGQTIEAKMNTSIFPHDGQERMLLFGLCNSPIESMSWLPLEVDEDSSSVFINGKPILHTSPGDESEADHYFFDSPGEYKTMILWIEDINFNEDVVIKLTFTKAFKNIIFNCE